MSAKLRPSDYWGAARIWIPIPSFLHVPFSLRLFCDQCPRGYDGTQALPLHTWSWGELIEIGARFVRYEADRADLVLPFSVLDLERVDAHFFHDVRGLWNHECITTSSIHVQPWKDEHSKPLVEWAR